MKKRCAWLSVLATFATILVAEPRGSAVKGRTLFAQCAGCHSADTNEKKLGPALKALFKHSRLENGKPLTEENVKSQLSKGSKGMPGFAEDLSDRDLEDLIAYLKTI